MVYGLESGHMQHTHTDMHTYRHESDFKKPGTPGLSPFQKFYQLLAELNLAI